MGLQLKHVAPIHLTVGPMDLVHPVYVSTLNTYPLLIGKDLLNRFEPLIDFKHLKIWTQVREPLPCQSLDSNESQFQVTDIAPKSMIDDAVAKPGSGPSTNSKDPFLCSLQEPESKHRPPSNHDCDRCPRHISVRHDTRPVGRELRHQPEAIQNTEAKISESTTCR